jgi:biopolymer transport protein ExbB
MMEVFRQAGWPAWILLAMSVLALAIVFDRLWHLRRGRVLPTQALETAGDLLALMRQQASSSPDLQQAKLALEKSSAAGKILVSGLMACQADPADQELAVQICGQHTVRALERGLSLLATLASLAPLVGLLGTVAAMIEAFGLQSGAQADPQALAAAIAMALHATGLGLALAIPVTLAHRLLRERCDGLVVDLELMAQHWLQQLRSPLRQVNPADGFESDAHQRGKRALAGS